MSKTRSRKFLVVYGLTKLFSVSVGMLGSLLVGMALRKQGITDPNYRHPQLLDHAGVGK